MLSFWNEEIFAVRYHCTLITLFLKLPFLDRQNCLKLLNFFKKDVKAVPFPNYYFHDISTEIKLYSYFFPQHYTAMSPLIDLFGIADFRITASFLRMQSLKKEWVLPPKGRRSLSVCAVVKGRWEGAGKLQIMWKQLFLFLRKAWKSLCGCHEASCCVLDFTVQQCWSGGAGSMRAFVWEVNGMCLPFAGMVTSGLLLTVWIRNDTALILVLSYF